jgi:Fe-S-cluster-containing dehydrogenase component
MTSIDRRSLLKGFAAAGATAAAGPRAVAAAEKTPPGDMRGLLFDATRCIGCQACMVACRQANNVPLAKTARLHDTGVDLSANARNMIKYYDGEGTGEGAFVKRQCMHCIEPACTAACMFGALQKNEEGVVAWRGERCTGCRYCQIACPFGIPKFEWESVNPEVVKCELCRHITAEGGIPACADVCPRDAVTYGRREDLLAEARRRIAAEPDRYLPKVYGEHDGGGTQVLYISHVQFAKLGLPVLSDRPVPETLNRVQGVVYKGFIAPIAAYAVLTAAIARNRRREGDAEHPAGHHREAK